MANYPKLQPADIFIEKTHDLFGFGVELFVNQKYQHVKMVRPDLVTCIEDGDKGIAIKQLETDWTNFEVWRIKDLTIATQIGILNKLETRLGETYGYLELPAAWLRKKFRLMVPDMPGADCSEFLSWGCREMGVSLFNVPDNEVTPWDFRDPIKLERIF